MVDKKYAKAATTAYADDCPQYEATPTVGKHIGGLRIAKVMYEHHPIHASADGSSTIGEMIDAHIEQTLIDGNLISEVSLFFETPEQQNALAEIYSNKKAY